MPARDAFGSPAQAWLGNQRYCVALVRRGQEVNPMADLYQEGRAWRILDRAQAKCGGIAVLLSRITGDRHSEATLVGWPIRVQTLVRSLEGPQEKMLRI